MTVSIEGTTPGIAVDGTGAVVNVTVTTGAGGGGGVELGETSTTAYRGDRGKTAYDHSQVTTGNPHGTTAADVGADPAGTAAGLVDDLSGVSNQATARTNLGLGTAATAATGDFAAASHTHTGTQVTVDASGFNGNLTTSDDTLQEVAQKLDDLVVGGSETLAASIIDAKGDLITGTAADTPVVLPVGSDGQYVGPLASATPGVAHRWPNGPEVNVAYRTGKYYTAGAMLAGSRTITANTLYYIPFPCMRTHTFDRIQSYCGTSGHSIRMGIYESGTDGLPGALLLDAGAATAPGNFATLTITISQALVGGTLYWLGLVSDSAATVVKCSPIGSQAFGLSGAMDSGGNQAVISQSHTYGALPSNASGLSYTNSVEVPAIGVRAS